MKVLMVNKFHYHKGGSETYYFDVAEGLKERGHEVHFFAMEDAKNEPCDDSKFFVSSKDYNGPTSIVDKIKAANSLVYSKEALLKFQALCEKVKPDVVHLNLVHRQITLSILDAPYLKQNNVPIVFTSHDYILVCPNYVMLDCEGNVCDDCLRGSFSPCSHKRCVKGSLAKSQLAVMEANSIRKRGSYAKIDRIIAPSEFMRSKLLEGGFPADQVICMRNFVGDSVLLTASDFNDATDWNNPYLLFFGRLSKEKGVDLLIEAASKALPDGWRVVVAGGGPEQASLESLSSRTLRYTNVEFVGFKQGIELQELISGAVYSVTPSRWRENMPYSIAESLAFGTPVIGANIGGIPELVIDKETGFLAKPNDSTSLAEAIKRALMFAKNKEDYFAMQEKCRNHVLASCNQENYMDNLVTLYQELIDCKKETH